MTNKEKTKQCLEFPFFGARYPDARCMNGYLWDMDSWEEDLKGFTFGGETPCPFCNTDKFIEDDPLGMLDHFVIDVVVENKPTDNQLALAKIRTNEFYLKTIQALGHFRSSPGHS